MFAYGWIESINKKWGNLKVKGENLLIYDDLAIVGTSSYSAYRSEVKSK